MSKTNRQPAIFLSHGGGPCFWITFPEPFGAQAFDKLRAYLAGLLGTLVEQPDGDPRHFRPLGGASADHQHV